MIYSEAKVVQLRGKSNQPAGNFQFSFASRTERIWDFLPGFHSKMRDLNKKLFDVRAVIRKCHNFAFDFSLPSFLSIIFVT
jgi:hypothetical protein